MKTNLVKTNLVKSAVLVASLMGALGSASAETLHANIAFGFSAGGEAMPAGAYSISTIPGAPNVLLFENDTTKMQAIVFARTSISPQSKPTALLTFTSSAAEGRELANIVTVGSAYELSVYPASKPLKGAALAIASASK
jgi:hypothetical protein